MTQRSDALSKLVASAWAYWLPILVTPLAQIQMAFNLNPPPVAIRVIVQDVDTPATSVRRPRSLR